MSSSYKIRNVAKQKLRGYHVRNEVSRSNDEYIKEQGIEVSNRFDALAIPATGMMSVDPVLTRVSKNDVLAGKKKSMIMSINDLAEEEEKGREQSQSSIAHPVQNTFRQYTGKPVNVQNKGPKYEMKITLFNRGFERDMM
jgi:hypothetical protein